MATLTRGTDEWTGSVNQTSQNKTYTFDTKDKISDKNIKFQINIPGIVIPTPSSGTNSFYITIGGITYNWTVDSDGNVWVE